MNNLRKMNAVTQSKKHSAGGLTLAVAAILIVSSFATAGALVPSFGATALNNVQVFVSTQKQDSSYNYYFSAYNTSGSLVATYQAPYPGAGFELPQGEYLFTVSAVSQENYCRYCLQPMMAGASTGATGASAGSTSGPSKSAALYPYYRPPSAEYGYQVEQVKGPDSITIKTANITTYPTTKVTVGVRYVNGTAAVNASVSASIVGGWYYWWGPNSTVKMWGETDGSGRAVLVLPTAPTVVSAWSWVSLNLPVTNRSEIVKVGGEKVNVTVRWTPIYIGLAANGLLLPPVDSITLTLHYQPFDYWIMKADSRAVASSGATVSSVPSGTPSQAQQGSASQYYLPSVIPPMNSMAADVGASNPMGTAWASPLVEGAITAALLIGIAGAFAVVFLRKRQFA